MNPRQVTKNAAITRARNIVSVVVDLSQSVWTIFQESIQVSASKELLPNAIVMTSSFAEVEFKVQEFEKLQYTSVRYVRKKTKNQRNVIRCAELPKQHKSCINSWRILSIYTVDVYLKISGCSRTSSITEVDLKKRLLLFLHLALSTLVSMIFLRSSYFTIYGIAFLSFFVMIKENRSLLASSMSQAVNARYFDKVAFPQNIKF